MRDFTLTTHRSLLEKLINKGYIFVRFDELVKSEALDVKSVIAESGAH